MSTPHGASVPRLLPDLKLALASLYSLPVPHGMNASASNRPSPKQAHEFLIHIQSRNIRRKILSIQQRHRDQQTRQQQPSKKNKNAALAAANDANNQEPVIQMGSSWLACLAILCQQTDPRNPMIAVSTTERLFAAQTILHRSRRIKLEEAIDLEMEQDQYPDENQALGLYHTNEHLLHLIPAYSHWLQGTNAFVAAVVHAYVVPASVALEDEERIKGELMLLTLAATIYLTACESHQDNQTQPILSTLGSAMAAIALRLRYTPTSIDQQCGPVPNSQPLVTLLTHPLALVWNTATALSMTNPIALAAALHACLSSIPDTLLGSPGGARGRLSIDPRCIQAATLELRTKGLTLLWETLHQHEQDQRDERSDLWTLTTCERWAKFLPLPLDFLQHTIPLVAKYLSNESPQYQRAAFAYLIAVCEGGSWTLEQVLASNLGLVENQLANQTGKKKQSSRSKKRQKEVVDTQTTDASMARAQVEVHQRGEIACQATMMVWDELNKVVQKTLVEANHHSYQVDGEGPIGCLATAANACLPYIIRNPTMPHAGDLFTALASTFRGLCGSPNQTARALSLEPLYTLHATVVDVSRASGPLDSALESLLVDHYVNCSMSLASSCGYPEGYFDNLAADGDEELEIERNDIRDILRAVAGSSEGGSTSEVDTSVEPVGVSLKILSNLTRACFDATSTARERKELAPEAVIHAFSSLAKPLNHVAGYYAQTGGGEVTREILMLSLQTLALVGDMIDEMLQHAHYNVQLLPVTRILNIATASLSPMLSALCSSQKLDANMLEEVRRAVAICVRTCALSITNIPELAAQSTLDQSQFDIRGTMRSPGGDDHVGCLALMRLSFESRELTEVVVEVSGPLIASLCELHGQLKSIEAERGRGVFHGKGVVPKSRRILLGALCHLEMASGGQAGAAGMLTGLFNSAVDTVLSFNGLESYDEWVLFQLCETTFDIAAFSPAIVASLFIDENPRHAECLKTLTRAGVQGYQRLPHSEASLSEWNRVRAAHFELIKTVASPDLPERALEMIYAIVYAECEAISVQCRAGQSSESPIFHDEVISPDRIPAGLLLEALDEIIRAARSKDLKAPVLIHNCIQSLYSVKDPVLAAISLECGDPKEEAFADPRPTLCEAWFLAMISLASLPEEAIHEATLLMVKSLLVDSCVVCLSILFYPSMGRTQGERTNDPGMSFDGPQTLALTEFLEHFFLLGPRMFEMLARELTVRIPVDTATIQQLCSDPHVHAMSIVGAALFRAAQGALPPWAVESIPEVYSALFVALNKDPDRFGLVLRVSMDLRLHASVGRFGSVSSGQLLSGRFFETMNDGAKTTFIQQAIDLSRKDNGASWRKLKVLIKQACGGKKKEADFGQKPSPTRWDFERL